MGYLLKSFVKCENQFSKCFTKMHSSYVRMALDRQRALERRRLQSKNSIKLALKSKLKECCRKVTAFLFTQIGVCGLLVGYTVVGAFLFIAVESKAKAIVSEEVVVTRLLYVDLLWNITHHLNVLHYDRWSHNVTSTLQQYQGLVVASIRRGYDASEPDDNYGWTFAAALMYCITIYTTIGYGNLTPKTVEGKLATICYALLGIPLMLLYMANVGEILASSFKYTYNHMCRCPRRNTPTATASRSARRRPSQVIPVPLGPPRGNDSRSSESGKRSKTKNQQQDCTIAVISSELETVDAVHHQVNHQQNQPSVSKSKKHDDPETVSVTSCLFVMFAFILFGAILFGSWEGWGFVDGSYFCLTSLLTVGFGDFVPGQTIYNQRIVDKQRGVKPKDYQVDTKLILCAVYLLAGMALIAMCVNLMQEEVFMKVKRFGRKLGLLRQRFTAA